MIYLYMIYASVGEVNTEFVSSSDICLCVSTWKNVNRKRKKKIKANKLRRSRDGRGYIIFQS